MKKFARFLSSALIVFLSSTAFAQDYPNQPIHIIVGWAAGGVIDIVARAVGKELSASFGQPVIIENRPGAGGTIGAETVARANPDGYTLMINGSGQSYYPSLYSKLPFDPVNDFTLIAPLAKAAHLLVVNQSLGPKTVQELVNYAKANPGKLSYASSGPGSPSNLAGEMFKALTRTDIVQIPYKGASPAMMDVLAGRVSMSFAIIPVALGHAKSGKIRILAIGSLERSPLLPDMPTLNETSVPGFNSTMWIGAFAPAKTPAAIVDKLNVELSKIVKTKTIIDFYRVNGMEPLTSSPQEFSKFFREDVIKWGKIIKDAGIKLD